jgi:N-acetylmuramoyl-L-alanine amidase
VGDSVAVAPTIAAIAPSTIVESADGKSTIFVTPTGAVTIVLAKEGSRYRVRTPCGGEARLSAGKVYGATTVVLDPGHGGFDPGASTASGLTEAALNLDVSKKAKAILDSMGYTTVLTREADYYVPIQIRAEIALAAAPKLFVSIHHNGGEAATHQGPGTEVYHQVQSAPAKRFAGLLWEEIVNTFTKNYKVTWWGGSDAGSIYRPDKDGKTDFFGVLRRTYPTIPAVVIEAGYMTNPQEADLMNRSDYSQNEAQAVANAVKRFLTTADPGSGFKVPNNRGFEVGTGGGGFDGCKDPKFS